jgi:hypothetical protein
MRSYAGWRDRVAHMMRVTIEAMERNDKTMPRGRSSSYGDDARDWWDWYRRQCEEERRRLRGTEHAGR